MICIKCKLSFVIITSYSTGYIQFDQRMFPSITTLSFFSARSSLSDTLPPIHWTFIVRWLPSADLRWCCPRMKPAALRNHRRQPRATLSACSRWVELALWNWLDPWTPVSITWKMQNLISGLWGRRRRAIRKELALLDRSSHVVQASASWDWDWDNYVFLFVNIYVCIFRVWLSLQIFTSCCGTAANCAA